jgi:uncharacterized membrane protein YciS (DUF1049 family)
MDLTCQNQELAFNTDKAKSRKLLVALVASLVSVILFMTCLVIIWFWVKHLNANRMRQRTIIPIRTTLSLEADLK